MVGAPHSLVPSNSEDLIWKALWTINAPPKIRIFLWQANHEESIMHMLLRCPWVEPIWFGGHLSLRMVGDRVASFYQWFRNMINVTSHPQDRLRTILSTLGPDHALTVLFMGTHTRISQWVTHHRIALARTWLTLKFRWNPKLKAQCNYVFKASTLFGVVGPKSLIIHASSNPDPYWSPSSAPFIKINVDASWFPLDGRVTLAAVLRDHDGHFVAAHKHSIVVRSVVFAEAMAMFKGWELAAELGYQWVVAESDSLEVVSSFKRDISNGSWEVFLILDSILSLGTSFQGCPWSWVPRLANQSADHLASRKNLEMCDNTWVRRPPSSLIHILNKDELPCLPKCFCCGCVLG
ncbi:hypothetical protein ACFX13_047678 [Malus domestica]